MSRCRRLHNLFCIVDEDFFVEIDRGFAWEVELTKDELLDSLKRANCTFPPGIARGTTAHDKVKRYANTPARLAMLEVNRRKLVPVMAGLGSPSVQAITPNDDALYLGSKVSGGARRMDREHPPKQVVGSKVHPDVTATLQ